MLLLNLCQISPLAHPKNHSAQLTSPIHSGDDFCAADMLTQNHAHYILQIEAAAKLVSDITLGTPEEPISTAEIPNPHLERYYTVLEVSAYLQLRIAVLTFTMQ